MDNKQTLRIYPFKYCSGFAMFQVKKIIGIQTMEFVLLMLLDFRPANQGYHIFTAEFNSKDNCLRAAEHYISAMYTVPSLLYGDFVDYLEWADLPNSAITNGDEAAQSFVVFSTVPIDGIENRQIATFTCAPK
ncbi:hypothetical protein [Aliiroseovarius crassostreae]|nr:hypothetical protein [Aliiroseovarius crassostreae]